MAQLGKYQWYWHRLRAMSLPEIFHRTGRTVRIGLERWSLGKAERVPPVQPRRPAARLISGVPDVGAAPYIERADEIVAGRFRIFALAPAPLGNPPRWNRDPSTGIVAPLTYGKTLDYRNHELVGDIKYLWEPNRHLHFVTLAQAYTLTRDETYLATIREHLDSWADQCPYPLGPNWASSLELAIRLINWSIVWNLLEEGSPIFDGERGRALKDRWLGLIYRHAHFIRGHLSRFSSANNHLIGEAAGLLVAGVTWPSWESADDWFEIGWHELAREASIQNAPDGVNLEQSTWYQHFVLEFMILSGLAARARDRDFPDAYWQRVEDMIEYLAAVMDVAGRTPTIGDADDGVVAGLDPRPDASPFRSVIATGAVLFSRGDFKAKVRQVDDKTLWLMGPSSQSRFQQLVPPARTSFRQSFPHGGYYVLGSRLETDREVRIVIDAGPLGYGSIAAHGHADALSYTLSIAGREILVDPGTYAYHTKTRWRDYFRGTSAHNTARVDGEDQSVIEGNFLWSARARAWCEIFDARERGGRFVGVHDGYSRLADPVVHCREIRLEADQVGAGRVLVQDTFECEGAHEVELFAHFAEQCKVWGTGAVVQARTDHVGVEMQVSGDSVYAELVRGRDDPPGGWISRSFDVRVPTTTAVWRVPISGTSSVVTQICYTSLATGEEANTAR